MTMYVTANYCRAVNNGFSIQNGVKVGDNFYNQKVPIPEHELIDKLKNGTAKKEPSTLDKIWSVIKEFFYGTDKENVCDALCTLFDKNSNQEYRTEALFKFMSYFKEDTAESKQPLAWHLTPDGRPRFSVSIKFSNGTFYSPTMAFSELAEAYNKSNSGWINSYTKEGLADSLYRHINYVSKPKDPNDYNAPNDPKVYENLTTFFADNAHNKENVSSFVALIKNITDESLFNRIMDRYVKKVISSKTHSTESNNTLVNNVKNYIYTGIYWIDLLIPKESLEDLVDVPFPCEENINYSLAKVFIDIITTSEDPKPALKYIKEKLFFIYEDKEGLLSAFKRITGNRNNQLLYQQYKRDALVIDLVTDLGNYLVAG